MALTGLDRLHHLLIERHIIAIGGHAHAVRHLWDDL